MASTRAILDGVIRSELADSAFLALNAASRDCGIGNLICE
jgi:hypothetical protein